MQISFYLYFFGLQLAWDLDWRKGGEGKFYYFFGVDPEHCKNCVNKIYKLKFYFINSFT